MGGQAVVSLTDNFCLPEVYVSCGHGEEFLAMRSLEFGDHSRKGLGEREDLSWYLKDGY